MATQTMRVPAEYWPENAENGVEAYMEVEQGEGAPGQVAVYTFVDGQGSKTSYYFDRESAIVFARDILNAVALDG